MTEFTNLGRHLVKLEDDLVIIHFIGPSSYAEWLKLREVFESVIARHGHAYMIAHVSKAESIHPSVRREFVTWLRSRPLLAVANVNPSIMARTLGVLMSNAIKLLGNVHYAMTFVEDEDAARRWIADLKRRKLGSATAVP